MEHFEQTMSTNVQRATTDSPVEKNRMKKTACAVGILLVSTLSTSASSDQSGMPDLVEAGAAAGEQQNGFESLAERYSYAYGADLANRFKGEGIDLDVDLFAAGMRDAFADDSSRMSTDEVAATLDVYHEIHFKKKEEARLAQGEVNRRVGEAFLAANSKKEGVQVTDSGLQYRIIEEGAGGYTPKEADIVTVHYRATLVDGSEFDSTYERHEPFSSKVRRLIPGWSEAIQLMTEGARWEVFIPSELAYGEQGASEFVGPHEVLIFEMELIDVEKREE